MHNSQVDAVNTAPVHFKQQQCISKETWKWAHLLLHLFTHTPSMELGAYTKVTFGEAQVVQSHMLFLHWLNLERKGKWDHSCKDRCRLCTGRRAKWGGGRKREGRVIRRKPVANLDYEIGGMEKFVQKRTASRDGEPGKKCGTLDHCNFRAT